MMMAIASNLNCWELHGLIKNALKTSNGILMIVMKHQNVVINLHEQRTNCAFDMRNHKSNAWNSTYSKTIILFFIFIPYNVAKLRFFFSLFLCALNKHRPLNTFISNRIMCLKVRKSSTFLFSAHNKHKPNKHLAQPVVSIDRQLFMYSHVRPLSKHYVSQCEFLHPTIHWIYSDRPYEEIELCRHWRLNYFVH